MKPFLKRNEVKIGLRIEVDGGFTCIEQFATRIVQSDNGDLWIKCRHGRHYLEGQLNESDEYVGICALDEVK